MSDNKDINNIILLEVRDDVKSIKADILAIKILDAKQNSDLEYHIKRTDLSEEQLHLLKAQLEPIKTHVTKVQGTLQFIGMLAMVAGCILAVIQIIQIIKGV